MRWILVTIYLLGVVGSFVGINAGFRHQCGDDTPGDVLSASLIWPVVASWAAFKNGAPFWKCERS